MKRRAFLLAAASSACHAAPRYRSELARGALGIAGTTTHVTPNEDAWVLSELATIAERAAARHRAGTPAARALCEALFQELGFVREVTSPELDFVLLPSVLRQRRGNCVGLGTVYLAVAQALGFRAQGVLRPGHFYVRHVAPDAPRNVELLRRGEAMPNAWYDARFPIPGGGRLYYGRPLSSAEVVGVIAYDVGNERRRQQRLPEAERAYARAAQLFPGFSEAHASLGAARQLLGKNDEAVASYQTARSLNPDLLGLDDNLALLQAERGSR